MALNPGIRMIELMEKVQPAYRMQPGEDFESWQEKSRKRLGELLGLPMDETEENFRIEKVQKEENCTQIRFLFNSEPEVDVSCVLCLPDQPAEEKIPLIICLQGHATGMHISLGKAIYKGDEEDISGGDRDFARQIVKRGQAALAIEQRGFGERGGTPEGPACHQPAVQAMLLGRTLIGQRCWDISRAIDTVGRHFLQLDMNRIGIMGNSGGGTSSIYAAAMDPRISVCMPSCAFCGYLASIGAQHHCLCNYIPGIMKDFDMGDLAGLIAPRPMIVVNGKHDGIFPLESAAEQAKLALERYYTAAGAPDKFEHVVGPEGHRFYAKLAWPVFDRLTGWKSNE